jgi:hypothetical protein
MKWRYYLADDGFRDVRSYGGSRVGRFFSKMRRDWDSETAVSEGTPTLRQVPDTWLILARIPINERD